MNAFSLLRTLSSPLASRPAGGRAHFLLLLLLLLLLSMALGGAVTARAAADIPLAPQIPFSALATPALVPNVTMIVGGLNHTCALTSSGGVKCWGYNSYGELGDGTTTDRSKPVDVLVSPGGAPLTGVTAITVGELHTCALMTSGGVKCWGHNSYGQLGDGTTDHRSKPADVLVSPGGAPLTGVTTIETGAYQTCALMTSGGVKCWGWNFAGQLGDGTTDSRSNPVDVLDSPGGAPLTGVTAITGGENHTCALASSGAKCWGWNLFGQLGDGSTDNRSNPVDVLVAPDGAPLMGVTAIRGGHYHTCALTTGGGVKCWGANNYGQLGDGTTTPRTSPVDVLVAPGGAPLAGVTAIAGGEFHVCTLMTNGGIKCWGYNYQGQLGDGTTADRSSPVDVLVAPGGAPLAGVTAIADGDYHTCALTSSGAKCWGINNHSQLGDGTTTNRPSPVTVSGLMSGVTAVAPGGIHSCALMASGGVKCWGNNGNGQLGDGTTISPRTSPVDVLVSPGGVPLGEVTAIAAGFAHTCALTSGGGVKCWGNNGAGQLGDGTTTGSSSPVDVLVSPGGAPLTGVIALEGTTYYNCALMTSEGVKCWGRNVTGQLGDGTTTDSSSPVDVLVSPGGAALSGIKAIKTAGNHACALTTSGIKCWGLNNYGQLGDGTTTSPRTTPVDVLVSPGGAPLAGVTAITGGQYHTCAVMTSAGAKCWGSNDGGEVGDGTTTSPKTSPVDVLVSPGGAPLSGAAAIVAGASHTCAVTTSGGVQCWGYNTSGQLGDGTTTHPRPSPTQVVGLVSGSTTVVVSTLNPVPAGQSLTFYAIVSGPAATPGGTVQFMVDGANLGNPVTLSNGGALSPALEAPAGGTHLLTAIYSGDANFLASTAAAVVQVVTRANTTTTLQSISSPSVYGDSVTFKATVNPFPANGLMPAGSVTFYEMTSSAPNAPRATSSWVKLGSAQGPKVVNGSQSFTWTTLTLSLGTHAIVAVYSGDPNFAPSTSAPFVQTVNPRVVENDQLKVQYNGWTGVANTGASGGSFRLSKTANDTVTFKFTGTSVSWVSYKGPDQGKATVTIDGVLKATLDQYAPAPVWQASKTFAGLTNRAHTLVIKVLGTKQAASRGTNIVMDAFKVGATLTVQESALNVQYNAWLGVSSGSASGGNYRVAGKLGSMARLTFAGTRVEWVTYRCKTCGKADVYLDGERVKTVDLYAATTVPFVVPFALASGGWHTIEIRVLGTKNALATGTNVYLDAFRGAFTVP